MLTLSEIKSVKGEAGNFQVEVLRHPRYVDEQKCIACNACAEKCPKKIVDHYNMGLAKRKSIYVEYAQAVPLKYRIDPASCIYLTKGKCGACKKLCPTGAVDFDQQPQLQTYDVGALILSPGFKPFDPTDFDSYQYAKLPNVVTSMEFERLLSASGPTMGHITRPSDGKDPKKIAWFQCVGSRDVNKCDNFYCSSVCCMYAVKEAVIAKEHAGDDLDCAVFYMDIRTHGKDFERYYDAARDKHGVRFLRSRVHSITEISDTGDMEVRYVTEDGELKVEIFDMIVLSIGLESSEQQLALAQKLDLKLTDGKFCQTGTFAPVETSRKGIYVCGAFQGPKDIPQAVVDSSAAAAAASEILSPSRNCLTKAKPVIPQTDVRGERPRVGVFVCSCGINIAGVVDVKAVTEYAAGLPYVEYTTNNLFACSQDTQDALTQIIKEKNLNRIVVAACTPKTHEPLFQETLTNAGLNKYLFEMANIRNQDSWVHKNNPELATEKAKDLVRMAVSKISLGDALEEAELNINQTAMIVGGGIAGMSAARSLAAQGYQTHIIEKADQLGGQARNLYQTLAGEDVQAKLDEMIAAVEAEANIQVHLNTQIANVEGFVGNFKSTLSANGKENVLEHGVVLMATGASPHQPTEYAYGKDPRILTALELDRKLIADDPMIKEAQTAVFIQCVGSREPDRPYCSRVCCTHAVDNALHLKKTNPDMNVFVLYRDIRTYGEKEMAYKKAREAGVLFVRFSLDNKPQVTVQDGKVTVTVIDHVLGRPLELETDLLTLATAIIPNKDEKLAQFFKVPMNADGFFVERHAKLGPSEFATDGAFLCGLAHYPKPIDESIAQGKAAAARAVTLLAREKIFTSGNVAQTDPMNCSRCGVCVSICPYSAPSFIAQDARMNPGKAEINPVLCKGCGLCVASCRSGAIHLKGFDNDQIFAQIFSLDEVIGQ